MYLFLILINMLFSGDLKIGNMPGGTILSTHVRGMTVQENWSGFGGQSYPNEIYGKSNAGYRSAPIDEFRDELER